MKKSLVIIGALALVFLLAAVAFPILFKTRIQNAVNELIAESVHAEIIYDDFDLSLLKNFPNLNVSVEKLAVVGQEIFDGLRDIKNHKKGKLEVRDAELSEPSEPKVIREKLELSQSAFAGLLGVSMRTLQDWEQGRRSPQGPAMALLRIAEQHPEVFTELQ